MSKETYKEALRVAQAEYNELFAKRQKLSKDLESTERRIGKLRETIVSLQRLCDEGFSPIPKVPHSFGLAGSIPTLEQIGLTAAVREVLKTYSEQYLFPIEVREKLIASGYDASQHANILAEIHAVLKRLEPREVESKEIEGKTAYKYKSKTLKYVDQRIVSEKKS